MKRSEYELFAGTFLEGDGRRIIIPSTEWMTLNPGSGGIRRHIGRLLVTDFIKSKIATHSKRGMTVWVLAQWCKEKNLGFQWEHTNYGWVSHLKTNTQGVTK